VSAGAAIRCVVTDAREAIAGRHEVLVSGRVAWLVWPTAQVVEGRTPGVVHVIEPA
jgi:hypothetical protein